MKKILCLAIILLTGCTSPASTPSVVPEPSATIAPVNTPLPTKTAAPTITPTPYDPKQVFFDYMTAQQTKMTECVKGLSASYSLLYGKDTITNKDNINAELENFEFNCTNFGSEKIDESLAAVNTIMKQADDQFTQFFSSMNTWIKEPDSVNPDDIFTYLLSGFGYLKLAQGEFKRISPDQVPVSELNLEAVGKIAFTSMRDEGSSGEIYVMNPDGSGQTRLTNNPEMMKGIPAWSPDRKKIAYQVDDGKGNSDIYVMNANGSGIKRLTNDPAVDAFPAWSPDGKKIAFSSNRTGEFEIFVMNADGSKPMNLTNDPAYDGYSTWSPDGTQIGFESVRDGNAEIYVMNADGSGQTRLTNNAALDGDPAWSPKGDRIAFFSDRDGNWEIYVMKTDGSEQTRLTVNPADDGYPAWSPDGKMIVFSSNRAWDYEVFIMNADGSKQANLSNSLLYDGYPSWSSE